MIKENDDLAGAIEAIKDKDSKSKKGEKQTIPDDWPWQEARELFKHPDVTPATEVDVSHPPRPLASQLTCPQFKWEAPDVDGLIQFLVTEKGFNEDRVRKQADKLRIALNAKQQGRLDGFFTVTPKEGGSSSPAKKRKAEEDKKKAAAAKKAKTKEKSKPRAAK